VLSKISVGGLHLQNFAYVSVGGGGGGELQKMQEGMLEGLSVDCVHHIRRLKP